MKMETKCLRPSIASCGGLTLGGAGTDHSPFCVYAAFSGALSKLVYCRDQACVSTRAVVAGRTYLAAAIADLDDPVFCPGEHIDAALILALGTSRDRLPCNDWPIGGRVPVPELHIGRIDLVPYDTPCRGLEVIGKFG